jgi:hypothetical protein
MWGAFRYLHSNSENLSLTMATKNNKEKGGDGFMFFYFAISPHSPFPLISFVFCVKISNIFG